MHAVPIDAWWYDRFMTQGKPGHSQELSQELEKIDGQLVALLERRALTQRKVGQAQAAASRIAQGGGPGEGAPLEAVIAKSSGVVDPAALRDVFRAVFSATNPFAEPTPVVYVGPEEGPSHAAARQRFAAHAKYTSVAALDVAFESVVRGQHAVAVVPYETRPYGPVDATIRALILQDLRIVACFDVQERLCIASKNGNHKDVDHVFATTADHAACREFVAREFPNAKVVDVRSSLHAAEMAASDHGGAAVLLETFAVERGLVVLQANARDAGVEHVRYAVVGPRSAPRTGRDLTALVFSVSDTPGALQAILSKFAEREINLTKIESRPSPGETWVYLFFMEIEGHATDRNVVLALEEVKRLTKYYKLLGSYARET